MKSCARHFFSRLKLLQYAGASLSQHVFDGLERHALAELDQRIMIVTGYGSTETAPFALSTTWAVEEAGHIGSAGAGSRRSSSYPMATNARFRVKDPNITPGYWREPANSPKLRSTRKVSTGSAMP